MIQSLLIANRGEIACRIIRTARAPSFLPGTGRGTARLFRRVVVGSGASGCEIPTVQCASSDPSVASRHLPVPGRI